MELARLTKDVLENGIPVYWYPMTDKKRISIATVIFAGSMHDPEGLEGLHHVSEHLPFRGTKSFPDQLSLFWEVEKYHGNIHAYTGINRTVFACNMPSIEGHRTVTFTSEVCFQALNRESDWELEREIIMCDEYRRTLNDPGMVIKLKLAQEIYNDPRVHYWPIGRLESINRITVEDIQGLHDNHYTANNAAVVVTGQYDDQLQNLIKNTFGSLLIKSGQDLRRKIQYHPTFNPEIRIQNSLFRDPVVKIICPLEGLTLKERWMCYLYKTMMSSNFSSPTFTILRSQQQLFYNGSVFANQDIGQFFWIGFSANTDEKKIARLINSFWEIHEQTLHNKDRFEFAQQRELSEISSSTEQVGNTCMRLVMDTIRSEWIDDEIEIDTIHSITFEELNSFIRRVFTRENSILVIATV